MNFVFFIRAEPRKLISEPNLLGILFSLVFLIEVKKTQKIYVCARETEFKEVFFRNSLKVWKESFR